MTVRVLLADDHALVRDALTRLLAEHGEFDVVGTACNGAEAIERTAALAPDVLLLDIALPDINGLDAIASLLEQSPETRILMLSMHAEPEYARLAVDRGAAGLISKSAHPESLVEAILSIDRGETLPIGESLSQRECEILEQITAGRTNQEICDRLSIRMKTVEGHCERLMAKLDIHTRAGLVSYGRRLGF